MAHQVFISYSQKDKPTADAACHALEARGVRCWIAPRDIQPGRDDWKEAITDALSASRVVVLVFSAEANHSRHVAREVSLAFDEEIPIIPVRIEEVPPSRSLRYCIGTTHWLDAVTPPLERHLETLADKVDALLGTPAAEQAPERAAPRATALRTHPGGRRSVYAWAGAGLFVLAALAGLAYDRSATGDGGGVPAAMLERAPPAEAGGEPRSGGALPVAEVSAMPAVPRLFETPYDVARVLLIREGWLPRENHWLHGQSVEVQSGNGPLFWERGYHELQACSGTGYAHCRFEFVDPHGRVLVVITQGEEFGDGSAKATVARTFFETEEP